MNNTVIIETPTTRDAISRIKAATKRRHAEWLIRNCPPAELGVLAQMAARDGRWKHVDWDIVESHLTGRTP